MTDLLAAARALDPEPIAELSLELLEMWAPPGGERAVAERLAEAFRDVAGIEEVELDSEFPASPSVITWLRGQEPGPTIQWHGHMDAIDVPHAPARREGDILHGRGACDMRAACAAMVYAARLLRDAGLPRRGNVLVTLHGLHESGGNEPLHRLIERGIHGDAVISGELGGGVTLPVTSLGLTFWSLSICRPGGTVHETNAAPDIVRPLEVARILLQRFDELNDRLRERVHPYVGAESVYVGKLVCGDYFNTVPGALRYGGHPASRPRHHGRSRARRARGARGAGAARDRRPDRDELERHRRGVLAGPRAPDRGGGAAGESGADRPRAHLIGSRASGNAVHFQQEAHMPCVYYGAEYRTAHSDHESVSVPDLARIAGGFALASAHYLDRT